MARLENWLALDGMVRRRGRSPKILDPDFILGVTEPDETNTGSRVPMGQIQHVISGNLTSVPAWATTIGGVPLIENVIVEGSVEIRIPRLIMRDFYVIGSTAATAQTFITATNDTVVDHLYEFGTIVPQHSPQLDCGFKGGNSTLRRMDISGCVDGYQSFGNPGVYKHFYAHGNYIHDHVLVPDSNQDDGVGHMDCHQSFGMLTTMEDIGNSYGKVTMAGRHRPNTSCILLQKSRGTYVNPVKVTDNWWYGSATAGACFHQSESMPGGITEGYPKGGLLVHRNRVARDAKHPRIAAKVNSRYAENFGMVGPDLPTNPTTAWTAGANCNVFMDDGSPVQVSPG